MIYADNAATTKMSETAVQTMISLMNENWGNPSSLYVHGQNAKEALEKAREDIAAVIGADPREIIFTSGGSEADNQAIRSAAALGAKKGKKHIITVGINAACINERKGMTQPFRVCMNAVAGNPGNIFDNADPLTGNFVKKCGFSDIRPSHDRNNRFIHDNPPFILIEY